MLNKLTDQFSSSEDPPRKQHYAIVLAAGASTRMGTCKATLPWLKGKSLLSYQVEQLLLAHITPLVVLGPHNAACQSLCPSQVQVIINPHPEEGKTGSILSGMKYLPEDAQSLLISAVDQPRPGWIYQALQRSHRESGALITVPTYQERMGHPLLFSAEILPRLAHLHEETLGLRQVVREFHAQIHRLEFNTPLVLSDINTPDCYQTELALHRKESELHPK